MPLIKIKETLNYKYALWKINESTRDLLNQLDVNKEELIEIEKFRDIKRKKQNISARLLLNILSKKKELLTYSKNGRPKSRSFKYISISHSNNYCILLTSCHNTGVDIQYKHPNIKKLSDKFLNTIEKKLINFDNKVNDLHFIWCAKESIYKTLDNLPCSFKKNIQIKHINNKMESLGYYMHNKTHISYNIEYEIMDNYFIGIAKQKS